MSIIVGYGCISTNGAIKMSDPKAVKSTKAFKELQDLFIPEDVINIDVIQGSYRKRPKLNNLINTLKSEDVIVITSLNSIGRENKEIEKNYRRIVNKGVGILIPNYTNKNGLDRYSTTDFGMEKIKTKEQALLLADEINKFKPSTKQGRIGHEVDENFITIYWWYERYLLDEKTSLQNKYIKMSKNAFYRACANYESNSQLYENGLLLNEEKFCISDLPKRRGIVAPQHQQIIDKINNMSINIQLVDNIIDNKTNTVHDITRAEAIIYKRWYLRKQGGRKAVAFASKNKDEKLIKKIQISS